MKIGDKVEVVKTPYNRVKNGTIATILDIKFIEYGKNFKLYILDTYPCHSFREWEIKEIENDKEE